MRDGEARMKKSLILGSASPRRRDLLEELGVSYQVVVSGVDETSETVGINPETLAEELALKKAQKIAAGLDSGVVLGADTIVTLDGRVYGKPSNNQEAIAMLQKLRNRTHTVVTGVALVNIYEKTTEVTHDTTQVTMRNYTDNEISDYIATGGPLDKAGAYGIQNHDFHPASTTKGCYTNVIGLPLCRVSRLLTANGLLLLQAEKWGPPESCPGCTHLQTEAV